MDIESKKKSLENPPLWVSLLVILLCLLTSPLPGGNELCPQLQASISRQFWARRRPRSQHGEPGEAADLPRLPGVVLQTRGHPALPAQRLPQMRQRHLPGETVSDDLTVLMPEHFKQPSVFQTGEVFQFI